MATKLMALRRDDACRSCSSALPAGTQAQWDSTAKEVTCLACVGSIEERSPVVEAAVTDGADVSAEIDVGDPGRSARMEHERRHAKREAKIEERWGTGRLSRVVKRLSDDPQTTKAWAEGASGEERVARVLHERLGDRAVLLHDRKVPGTRGNIDHLAVAPSGVWVIDAKKYKGKVERRDVGGWFKTDIRLYVDGRDRTKTVTGLGWQIAAVRTALEPDTIPIHAALSFVGAEWPIFFAKPLQLGEVWISWPQKLADLIEVDGPLEEGVIDRIARLLSVRFPAH